MSRSLCECSAAPHVPNRRSEARQHSKDPPPPLEAFRDRRERRVVRAASRCLARLVGHRRLALPDLAARRLYFHTRDFIHIIRTIDRRGLGPGTLPARHLHVSSARALKGNQEHGSIA